MRSKNLLSNYYSLKLFGKTVLAGNSNSSVSRIDSAVKHFFCQKDNFFLSTIALEGKTGWVSSVGNASDVQRNSVSLK